METSISECRLFNEKGHLIRYGENPPISDLPTIWFFDSLLLVCLLSGFLSAKMETIISHFGPLRQWKQIYLIVDY